MQNAEELKIVSRRCSVHQDLLRDHLDLALSTLQELSSYATYLRSTPASAACLLLTDSHVPNLQAIQQRILKQISDDWNMVVLMESKPSSAKALHKLCPHVLWQVFREVCVVVETSSSTLTSEVASVAEAWYPRLSFSANIEEQFNSMEDRVTRGNRAHTASLPNLSATAVRSISHKMLDSPGQASSVKLQDADWEGPSVRALKPKLFSPETFTGRLSARFYACCC